MEPSHLTSPSRPSLTAVDMLEVALSPPPPLLPLPLPLPAEGSRCMAWTISVPAKDGWRKGYKPHPRALTDSPCLFTVHLRACILLCIRVGCCQVLGCSCRGNAVSVFGNWWPAAFSLPGPSRDPELEVCEFDTELFMTFSPDMNTRDVLACNAIVFCNKG